MKQRYNAFHTSGCTGVSEGKSHLLIIHAGNMGASIAKNVDPDLKHMGFPSVAKLKKTHKVLSEEGSPDYLWKLSLKKPKP